MFISLRCYSSSAGSAFEKAELEEAGFVALFNRGFFRECGRELTPCSTICYTFDMRTTLNISMPASLKRNVDLAVKEGNYASVSEFFRDALRAWEEEQVYQSVMRSQKDFAEGKFKRLRSLKDLM